MSAAPPNFFDLLSDDTISIIVRHTSTRPFADDWHEHVDTKDLLSMLKCSEGRVRYWARDVISRQHYVDVDMQIPETPSVEQIVPHLRSMQYTYCGDVEILQPLLHTSNLGKLHLLDRAGYRLPLDVILGTCGATLDTLSVYSRSMLGIRNIGSTLREYPELKELNLRLRCFIEDDFEPLWPVIGKTLTKLALISTRDEFASNIKFLRPIARNCVVLEDVRLNHPNHVWLYKQLGSLLKIIRLYQDACCLSPYEISAILESCPNAKVHGCLSNLSDDTFGQLSSRIASCSKVRMLEPFPEMPFLREAGIVVTARPFTTVKSFFERPIPSLRKLYLRVEKGNAFETVSKSVTYLEELLVAIQFFDVEGAFGENDLDDLLDANRGLRKLQISFYGEGLTGYEKVERFLVAMFGSLKNLSELNEVVVSGKILVNLNETIVRDACVPLRKKRISIIWNDVGSI